MARPKRISDALQPRDTVLKRGAPGERIEEDAPERSGNLASVFDRGKETVAGNDERVAKNDLHAVVSFAGPNQGVRLHAGLYGRTDDNLPHWYSLSTCS